MSESVHFRVGLHQAMHHPPRRIEADFWYNLEGMSGKCAVDECDYMVWEAR